MRESCQGKEGRQSTVITPRLVTGANAAERPELQRGSSESARGPEHPRGAGLCQQQGAAPPLHPEQSKEAPRCS